MLENPCLLRLGVSLAIAISTFSVAAQNTPVPAAKAPVSAAQSAATDTAALAKATQNPVASLISVPLQNNANFGVGQYNRTGDVFNIQPVIPMKLNDKTMLITRVIQPHCLAALLDSTHWRPGWIWGYESDVFSFSCSTWEVHLGGGSDVYFADCYKFFDRAG
jgi:hypothetical protein